MRDDDIQFQRKVDDRSRRGKFRSKFFMRVGAFISFCFSLILLSTIRFLPFQAVGFVCFLIGFVAVLCLGNYYRALRAMERQRQRRLARLSVNAGNGVVGLGQPSPSLSSNYSTTPSHFLHHDEDEQQQQQQHLMMQGNWNNQNLSGPSRRRQVEDDLLFDVEDTGPRQQGLAAM